MSELELEDGATLRDWMIARKGQLVEAATYRDQGLDPRLVIDCGIPELMAMGVPERKILTLIAGHSGDGKTAMAFQALEGAARAGYHSAFFPFEDPPPMMADRAFSGLVRRPASEIRFLRIENRKSGKALLAPELETMFDDAVESADWAHRIRCWGTRVTPKQLLEIIRRERERLPEEEGEELAMFAVDYAQVFVDAKGDAPTVLADLTWQLNELTKDRDGLPSMAGILLSQVTSPEIGKRGMDALKSWKFANRSKENPDPVPDRRAIDGFRPLPTDLAWAPQALLQKSRDGFMVFRPNAWLRKIAGVDVPDDIVEIHRFKSNYSENSKPLVLSWNGPLTKISSPVKKQTWQENTL